VFWVISVYFNIRNTLPKFGTFLLGHLYIRKTLRVKFILLRNIHTRLEGPKVPAVPDRKEL